MNYTNKEYDELSSNIKINRDCLDEEAIEQPNLFFHVSEAYALAVAAKDSKKLDLDFVEAELDSEIREQAAADERKITEPWVKQEIIRDKIYQQAALKYNDASLTANKWLALKDSYRQRADMLKVLEHLHSSGYYGEVTGAAERNVSRVRFDQKRS